MGESAEPLQFGATASLALPDPVQLLRLQTNVLSHRGFAEAATALANLLCEQLHCDRVSVGWREGECTRIVALSHSAQFDRRQPLLEKIAAAMDEAAEQASPVVLPQPKDASSQVAMAHGELLAAGAARALCTVLLATSGEIVGAATMERAAAAFTSAEMAFCQDAANLNAPVLELKHRAELSWPRLTWRAARSAGAALLAPGNTRARLMLGGLGAAALAALLMPVPFHVSAPARLEGFVQRAVTAPLDGYLEQVNVRPGDAVKEGQVLALLATQDLQTERLKWQSELAQHQNLYQAALARADRTQLVVNQARAAEAQAQLSLIEHRLERAQMRAPFDGVVIKGDLSQQLGAPVQRGEVLLTVAPDNRYRLVVEVDERDIASVQTGMSGRVAFAALPGETLQLRVTRLIPVAVSADGRNFFEAEATLDGGNVLLRPGMRGIAKIGAGRQPAAWIATHRLFDWLRLSVWSFGA